MVQSLIKRTWCGMVWLCYICYFAGEMADSTVGYCSTVRLCINSAALAGRTHCISVARISIHWISRILRLRSRIRFRCFISGAYDSISSNSSTTYAMFREE